MPSMSLIFLRWGLFLEHKTNRIIQYYLLYKNLLLFLALLQFSLFVLSAAFLYNEVLTLIRMTKDEKVLAFFKGLLL